MHPYLQPLITSLQEIADPATAEPMKKYLRDQFDLLGIKAPRRKECQKTFFNQHGLPPIQDLDQIMRDLWSLPQREFQYAAMDMLDRRQTKLTPAHVPLLEYLITTKSWWDTVDGLAARQVGKLFLRHPEIRDEHINRWRQSDNIWLRRTTLLFQFPWKKKTDKDLLFALIKENLDSDEFFIQKAIGWALREYSKSDAGAVVEFVANTNLPPLSHREALKWLKNQGMLDDEAE